MEGVEGEVAATLTDLEEISFRNLVEWFADELRQIASGVLSSNVLTKSTSVALHKHGVLERCNSGNIGQRSIPTRRAAQIMEKIQ